MCTHWGWQLCNTQNRRVYGLRPSSGILNKKTELFGHWIRICHQVRGGRHQLSRVLKKLLTTGVQWLSLALFKGPSRVNITLLSPEDGHRSSPRNVVLSSYLEFRTWTKSTNPAILTDVLVITLEVTRDTEREEYRWWWWSMMFKKRTRKRERR
jgi:hypothetical protein